MMGLRHRTTGELQIVERADGYPESDWERVAVDQGDAAALRWTGGRIADDPAIVERELLARLHREAERRRMQVVLPGSGRARADDKMRAEVRDFRGLATTAAGRVLALAGMAPEARGRKFRFAEMSAARAGEAGIAAAIARFEALIDPQDAELARLNAIEEGAEVAIGAAATAAAKRAAFGAVDWEWRT